MPDPTPTAADLAEAERAVRRMAGGHQGRRKLSVLMAEYDRRAQALAAAWAEIEAGTETARLAVELRAEVAGLGAQMARIEAERDRLRSRVEQQREMISVLTGQRNQARSEAGDLAGDAAKLRAQRAAVLALLDHDTDLITAPQLAKIVRQALGETE